MSSENNRINVALILGGISGERPVSLETGNAVFKALKDKNFNVKLIDPTLGKNQYANDADYWEREINEFAKDKFFETFCADNFSEIDVAFIALHGPYGEDGVTQMLLDLLGIPYVGSGSFASALAMSKYTTKVFGEKNGVKFPKGFLVERNSFDLKFAQEKIKNEFGGKFVVKPNQQGSSLGLSVCESADELETAVNKGFEADDELLIEEFIEGRELTVSVLHGKALPVLEIRPESGLYDFEAKYETDTTRYLIPAPIDENIATEMQNSALKVFNALGCEDYARVDFRMRENGEFYCLEINTLPGMTSHSLLPKAAAFVGIDFNSLIEGLILKALKK